MTEMLWLIGFMIGAMLDPILWVVAFVVAVNVRSVRAAAIGGAVAAVALRLLAWSMSQQFGGFNFWAGVVPVAASGAIVGIVLRLIVGWWRQRGQ